MSLFKKILLTRIAGFDFQFMYRVSVTQKGKVKLITYSGDKNRERSRTVKYQISDYKVRKLNSLISRIDYFNLKKTENRWKLNTPGCVTAVELDNGKKRLVKNLLNLSSYPKELFYFEDVIDNLLKIREHYKTNYSPSLSYF